MEQIILKEELEELLKIKGEIRGVAIKGEMEFVLKEEGEEGLKKLEDQIAGLGYPIKYKEIKAMNFYPIGFYGSVHLLCKKLFNWENKKFQEMGRFESKTSLIARLFMKYFFSADKIAEETPKMWRKYCTVGDLKVVEYDLEKRYVIDRLENLAVHPLSCQILLGYLPSIVEMIVKNPVTCEETKCVHRGDEYHEFLMKW